MSELDKLIAEMRAHNAEMREFNAEMRQASAEMREYSREAKESTAEMKREIIEIDRKLTESLAESERKMRESLTETDRILTQQLAETDRKLTKQISAVSKQMGDFTNAFGDYTESLATPSIRRILKEQFDITIMNENVFRRKESDTIEMDVLGIKNDKTNIAVIVEVKSALKKEDIKQITKTMQKFYQFFHEYKNYKLYGIIACVGIKNKSLIDDAINNNLYLAIVDDNKIFDVIKPKNSYKK